MFRRTAQVLAMISLFLITMHGVAAADEFHYNNFLIGDRAAGMGGAYTAISDDPSGLYYNPAGIMYSTGRNLSASLNAYYNMTKKYNGVIGGQGWDRKSSSLLPNFFGIIQPLGKFKFGFSYAVPDSIKEDQDQIFYGSFATGLGSPATQYIINFNNEDNTYLFGPSLAMEIAKNLSAGLTLYIYHRSAQSILNQHILLSSGAYEWSNQYIEKVERGYKPILGFMYTPVEKVSVGISIGRTFVYGSSVDSQVIFKDANAGTVNDFTLTLVNDSESRDYPWDLRLGVAYFPSSSLVLSGDVNYYTKVSDPVRGDRVAVMNVALGAEYFLNKSWAVRGGLFSNMANTPDVEAGRFNQDEKIDLYGLSLSISNFTRNTSITFGGNLSMGSGDAQILANTASIQSVDSTSWMIFLSSSYSY
jgi:long-chain fatty acid transport protein